MRWTSILALVALDVASARSRSFAASPLELTWNAPAACPESAAVYHDVERSLGPTPAHRVVARADVTELAADRWSVRLTTEVDPPKRARPVTFRVSCARTAPSFASARRTRAPRPGGATSSCRKHVAFHWSFMDADATSRASRAAAKAPPCSRR